MMNSNQSSGLLKLNLHKSGPKKKFAPLDVVGHNQIGGGQNVSGEHGSAKRGDSGANVFCWI